MVLHNPISGNNQKRLLMSKNYMKYSQIKNHWTKGKRVNICKTLTFKYPCISTLLKPGILTEAHQLHTRIAPPRCLRLAPSVFTPHWALTRLLYSLFQITHKHHSLSLDITTYHSQKTHKGWHHWSHSSLHLLQHLQQCFTHCLSEKSLKHMVHFCSLLFGVT